MGFTACLVVGILLAMFPLEYYLQHRRVEEWMIYRFVACFLLGSVGFLLVCAAVLSSRMSTLGSAVATASRPGWPAGVVPLPGHGAVGVRRGADRGLARLALAGHLRVRDDGQDHFHWSRLLVGTFGLFMAAQAMVTWVMVQIVNLWSYQKVEEARLAADVPTIAPREAVVPGPSGVTG